MRHYKIIPRINVIWNKFYFSIFSFEKFLSKLILIPISLIFRIKKIHDFYVKKGVANPEKAILNSLNNEKEGTNIIFSHIHIAGVIGLIECLIINLFQIFFFDIYGIIFNGRNWMIFAIVLTAIPGLINHFLLFRNDVYLEYFKDFEKYSRSELKKIHFLSGLFYFTIIVSLFFSFFFINIEN